MIHQERSILDLAIFAETKIDQSNRIAIAHIIMKPDTLLAIEYHNTSMINLDPSFERLLNKDKILRVSNDS